MKQHWNDQLLAEHWSLTDNELNLLANRTERSRLGFAVLCVFAPKTDPAFALNFDLTGRSSERYRGQIRNLFGFRVFGTDDADKLAAWLREEVLPEDLTLEHLQASVGDWCRENRIESPTPGRSERIIRSTNPRPRIRFI